MADAELNQIFLYELVRVKGDSGRGERLAPLNIDGLGTGEILQGEMLSPEDSERIYKSPKTLLVTHIASTNPVPGSALSSYTYKEEYHVYSGVGVDEPTVDFTVDVTPNPNTYSADVEPLQKLRREVAEKVSERPINLVV